MKKLDLFFMILCSVCVGLMLWEILFTETETLMTYGALAINIFAVIVTANRLPQ